MRITIDTKNDTKEEIKKTIEFLKTLIDAQSYQSSFEPAPETGSAFGAMFGSDNPETLGTAMPKEEKQEKIKLKMMTY